MKLAIVKYNAGNTASVINALNRLNIQPIVTDDAETLMTADKVIFPGVGEASTAMRYLRDRGLDRVIKDLRQPVLGICLGMQLMCRSSEENDTKCLAIFDFDVRKFTEPTLKIPHIGWNNIMDLRSTLFSGLDGEPYVYFVHGYYVESGEATTASCDYGVRFSAAIEHENFYAVQFHPEKSGTVGEIILENFINL
jgi:imidazole glycerol-phosphate synthase subunit HisH